MECPLATGSVEKWYIEDLQIPGGPCRDGRPSDEQEKKTVPSEQRKEPPTFKKSSVQSGSVW